MSAFDPYHKWLGIPPQEQPANHYRLLGIALFEEDREVIEAAADQRMAFIQQFATGQHGPLSQQILNQLAQARVTLLDAERRAQYDTTLLLDEEPALGHDDGGEESPRKSAGPPDTGRRTRESNPGEASTAPEGGLAKSSDSHSSLRRSKSRRLPPRVSQRPKSTRRHKTNRTDHADANWLRRGPAILVIGFVGVALLYGVVRLLRVSDVQNTGPDSVAAANATQGRDGNGGAPSAVGVGPSERENVDADAEPVDHSDSKTVTGTTAPARTAPPVDDDHSPTTPPAPPKRFHDVGPLFEQRFVEELIAESSYVLLNLGPDETSESGNGAVSLKGRGQPYVSVRGVIPLQTLVGDVAASRTCDEEEARTHLKLVDFELERQTADRHSGWPGEDKWQPVDRVTAEAILHEVDGYDPDIVPAEFTHPSVTMPLPARITGAWVRQAAHPDIPVGPIAGELGANDRFRSRGELADVLAASAESTKGQGGTGSPGVLLFRFIDFAVEPDRTYRYRVRLELANPCFGEAESEAVGSAVVLGETRFSAWSELSQPVSVERATYYFVREIYRPYRELNSRRVALDFYHFDPRLGTIVSNAEPDPPEDDNKGRVPSLEVGFAEPIAGDMTVWELSPADLTFAKDEEGLDEDGDPRGYSFDTGDLLVAALEDIDLSRQEHRDLRFPRYRNYDLQLVDAILVQKRDGTLQQLDTVSQKPWREYQEWKLEQQNKPFRALKAGSDQADALCPDLAELYEERKPRHGIQRDVLGLNRDGSSRLRAEEQAPAATPPPSAVPLPTVDTPQTVTSSIGLKLSLIPAGEFLMGSQESKLAGWGNEFPQHNVRITHAFYLGVHEVTQREWETVMGSQPSYFSNGGGGKDRVAGLDTSTFPVEQVSWYDGIEFCNRLSQLEGFPPYYTLKGIKRGDDGSIESATVSIASGNGYRLPTEAEWEYSCRAGTTTPFHFGMHSNGKHANIDGNRPYGTTRNGQHLQRTTSVEEYTANAFGLYDMHGNVYEFCFDVYDAYAYRARDETTSDPIVASTSGPRVIRGGTYGSSARGARSAYRSKFPSDARGSSVGFRVARTP